jgi:hypothetical protein
MNSTHLVHFGEGRGMALAIICGQYYKWLRPRVFAGGCAITRWSRIPSYVKVVGECSEPMIEVEGSGMMNTSDNLK